MLIKFFKFALILLFFQSPLYSKNKTLNNFNSHYLSNYFSGIIAYENKKNSEALKFFKSSKYLIKRHNPYLKRYIYTLVLEERVPQAINEIKNNLTENNSNFFEVYLILALDSLRKKNYEKSKLFLEKAYEFTDNDRLTLVIVETLKQYLYVFEKKDIPNTKNKFGNFSFISEVFQKCYLNDKDTNNYFGTLVNTQNEIDYSRYIFFHINYLIEENRHVEAKKIIDNLDYLNSSLLAVQGKIWFENKEFEKFGEVFSCKDPEDIVGEFLFLIANINSSQGDYEKSNFYLNLALYLNPKFKFNLSLLSENYYFSKDYSKTLKILKSFNEKDELYYWFKLKKEAQIISQKENDEASADFINSNIKKIQNPPINIILDLANFNQRAKKFNVAIKYYNQIISKIDTNTKLYATILFERARCYERLNNYKNSDNDLLKSLEIIPDNAYVLNYLAYSWLEREYKVDTALAMLEKAYAIRNDDPYIIDSIGWAYYLVKEYVKAEIFLRRAVELMPLDPIVNDHYGDILWQLDRKIQARYFWQAVLNLDETEDAMKETIKNKLIEGLKNS